MKTTLSIRTTLLLILSLLNLLIATQMGYDVIIAALQYRDAHILQKAHTVMNTLFTAERHLSEERATSIAILNLPGPISPELQTNLVTSRAAADNALDSALSGIDVTRHESLAPLITNVQSLHREQKKLRSLLDIRLTTKQKDDATPLSDALFASTNALISEVHNLLETYSLPLHYQSTPVARQLRFSSLIWGITETAGQEYTLLGRLIARNRYPSLAEQESLLMMRGRIQFGWELAHSAAITNPWAEQIRPLMEEAETHYFTTFDQVKQIFQRRNANAQNATYPVNAEMWLALASQATGSFYALNEELLRVSDINIQRLSGEAREAIIIRLLLFLGALAISIYSWRVIINRVIRPVDAMVTTLYRATQGELTHDLPFTTYPDEIGKLADVLQIFQNNSAQLQIERDRAQAANIAKTEFLANMSHEIRTPMNVVLGLSNILARSEPLTDQQREFIGTLKLSAESLLSLINDLLDFSRIEAQNYEMEAIPFKLSDVVDDVVALIAVKAREKNLSLSSNYDDISGQIYRGDPTRLRQCLLNVCSNAVKFTPKGKVAITITRAPHPDRADHDHITIAVHDTGIGIEPEQIPYIFDKFTQADSSISRKFGGTGLGLAITRRFLEIMGGTIAVQSTPHKGTVFTIEITLQRLAADTPLPAPPYATQPAENINPDKSAKILLVEDYPPNAMIAALYLEELGLSCDLAQSGDEAIEKFKNNNYHAVLMDVQMPGMDGYQTTRALRAYEKETKRRPVRIIGITAHAMPGDQEKCIAAGMDDYLPKPFQREELRDKLIKKQTPIKKGAS